MSTFTLAISCLTPSNLPWFMDLTFQVPMQYCSLQHWTFLLSPVTSTTGHCFCFGSIPSFFLELFLHWSPVAYCAPSNLGSSSFSILSFCLSHTVHGILKARTLKWFAISFSSGPHSVIPLHHDPTIHVQISPFTSSLYPFPSVQFCSNLTHSNSTNIKNLLCVRCHAEQIAWLKKWIVASCFKRMSDVYLPLDPFSTFS